VLYGCPIVGVSDIGVAGLFVAHLFVHLSARVFVSGTGCTMISIANGCLVVIVLDVVLWVVCATTC
jgi:hypothetical protein